MLVGVIGVFQVALALGAPWGRAAWGGQHEGVLPTRLRIASGIAGVLVYPFTALFILGSSELIGVDWLPARRPGMWIVAAFFMLGAVANVASRSRVERIWGPISLVIAICSAIIALARGTE